MCLGVPGKVVSVNGNVARVDFFGVQRDTRLDLVDEAVAPGDYILNHVGFAIRRIPAAEIIETLALYERLLQESDDDIMASDVRGEIEAAHGTAITTESTEFTETQRERVSTPRDNSVRSVRSVVQTAPRDGR